jgi:hypothetical protein
MKYYALLLVAFCLSCDKQNEDLITPLSADAFPQVVLLADEGDGDLEDEDKFSFKITLAEKKPGAVLPLEEDITVQFAITGFEGFAKLQDYIKGAEAFYEIDDCTTSLDKGIDLNLQFNLATGTGSVTFPKGVEEIEIEFETDDNLFDDGDFNNDERSLSIQLTGINSNRVAVNKTAAFKYHVQDDEGIYGEWELDIDVAAEFARFKALFGLVNKDLKDLSADEVEEITISFEYEEVKATIVLKETEMVDDCGSPSMENKVIEIEADIEDLDDDALDGDVEFGDGFVYKGAFAINGKQLQLTLQGEYDDENTDEITLILEK